MKKKTKIYVGIGGGLAALMIMGMAASPSDTEGVPAADASATIAAEAATVEAPEVAPEPEMTVSQQNALRSAESYLDFAGFSEQGLIDQLSSEYGDGYPLADAEWAVAQLDVDWNEQAVRSAESYLEFTGFSRDGLIDQLSSEYGEQFTVEQATYAADSVGL